MTRPLEGPVTTIRDSLLAADTPTMYNKTMTLANTEYSQALPSNVKRFTMKCRTANDVQFCYVSGESNTKFMTLPAGMVYWEENLNVGSLTLYFRCAVAAKVIEIIAWV